MAKRLHIEPDTAPELETHVAKHRIGQISVFADLDALREWTQPVHQETRQPTGVDPPHLQRHSTATRPPKHP
jgi:hypothetical protein